MKLEADLRPGAVLTEDLDYGTRDFERITEMLHRISGIRMPPSNEALVFSRLSRRVRGLGLNRFADYVAHVESPSHQAERDAMVSALTTNTTRFFREDYHYDTLASEVLPRLIDAARAGGRVRLWSAACSSGEEAFSMAAVLLREFPDAARHDVRILATDICREALAAAEKAEYPEASAESVPNSLMERMFEPAGPERLRIRRELRDLVTVRYMNFMEPWPVSGPFDAIFCRNVMIYMEDQTQAMVWASLASVMPPGGYLFIGHSERIGPEFKDQLQLVGKTTFRRL